MSDKKNDTNNKSQSTDMGSTQTFFRSYSVYATCPSCKTSGPTNSAQSCSIMNYCFFCYCDCCWLCYTISKRKDFNCTNTVHKCGSCGALVGEYNAC